MKIAIILLGLALAPALAAASADAAPTLTTRQAQELAGQVRREAGSAAHGEAGLIPAVHVRGQAVAGGAEAFYGEAGRRDLTPSQTGEAGVGIRRIAGDER